MVKLRTSSTTAAPMWAMLLMESVSRRLSPNANSISMPTRSYDDVMWLAHLTRVFFASVLLQCD